MKRIILITLITILASTHLFAFDVRIKDLAKIIEVRDNQLIGFGLVVGLKNSGDSRNTFFTPTALKNLLNKMGIAVSDVGRVRNTAAVMVTATLPSFVKAGQRISVTVSALGDASNLSGGTLIMTPLKGADMQVYAVAQGPVVVGGEDVQSRTQRVYSNQPTVGLISDGAIVEKEVPVTFNDQHNITIVFNDTSFENIKRAVNAIQNNGFLGARAIDARQIKIPLTDINSASLVETIANLENIRIQPDASSKIVINAKTGTIVIGEMVRLNPVALTHGRVSIRITEPDANAVNDQISGINIETANNNLVLLRNAQTLSGLVDALNNIGASPKDLISIIQALKESGALIATVEII